MVAEVIDAETLIGRRDAGPASGYEVERPHERNVLEVRHHSQLHHHSPHFSTIPHTYALAMLNSV